MLLELEMALKIDQTYREKEEEGWGAVRGRREHPEVGSSVWNWVAELGLNLFIFCRGSCFLHVPAMHCQYN